MNNAKLKLEAKQNLKGNYQTFILCLLVFLGLSGGAYVIASLINTPWLSSILMLIFESLFVMGFISMLLKVSRQQKIKFKELFDETDLFLKYIALALILGIIGIIIGFIEGVAFHSLLVIISHYAEMNGVLAVSLITFGLLLSVAIIMFGIYITISFSQVLFILKDEPNLSIKEILSKSFEMMADYIIEYFILVISFIGWFFLGIFTLGLLYFWIIPYMGVTLANFYNKIKAEYEETIGDDGTENIFKSSKEDNEDIEMLF